MKKHDLITFGALLATAALWGCTPEEEAPAHAGATGPSVAQVAVSRAEGRKRNNDCWWHRYEDTEFAAVWLSPRLTGEVPGGFRFVNLVFHDPNCRGSTMLAAGVGQLSKSDPVALGNGSVKFRVTPRDGRTWGDVASRRDLDVVVERVQ